MYNLDSIYNLLEQANDKVSELEVKKENKSRKKKLEIPEVDHATIFNMTLEEYIEWAAFMEWEVMNGHCPIEIPSQVPCYLIELGLQKLVEPERGTPRKNYTPDELLYQDLKRYTMVRKVHWKHAIGRRIMKWVCYYNGKVFTWESKVNMESLKGTPELSYKAELINEVQKITIEECTTRKVDGSIKKFNGSKSIRPYEPTQPIAVKAIETSTVIKPDGNTYKVTKYDVGGIVVPKYIKSGNEFDTKGKADRIKAKVAREVSRK